MGALGCGCSAVAVLFAIIGILPLLGWLNWLTSIPIALLAIVFCLLALRNDEQRGLATLGLIAGTLTLFWALFRLALGGGVL